MYTKFDKIDLLDFFCNEPIKTENTISYNTIIDDCYDLTITFCCKQVIIIHVFSIINNKITISCNINNVETLTFHTDHIKLKTDNKMIRIFKKPYLIIKFDKLP